MKIRKLNLLTRIGWFGWVFQFAIHDGAQASGKGNPIQNQCPKSNPIANPVRPVRLRPVISVPFQLPNGGTANFQADLQSMLNTAVTNDSNFAPVEKSSAVEIDPCSSHLELAASVSSFQLDAVQLGFSVGFNPQGSIPILKGVTGKALLNVGNISMDFSVLSCSRGVCTSVAASSANHLTVGGSLSLEVDFGLITTGPQLLLNTPLGDFMRKIIQKGILDLAQSSHLNEIPWEARVKEYIPETQFIIFDAGAQSRIAEKQEFEIYAAPEPGQNSGSFDSNTCQVYRVLAYAHTVNVSAVSSVAVIDQIFGPRDSSRSTRSDLIRPGDLVMIHWNSSNP